MEISTSENTVTIHGNIKSINDFQKIKQTIDPLTSQHNSLVINVIDSLSVTSSVIGYFNKLVLKDNINLSMNIGDTQLLSLLDDLNLTSTFKAKKVNN